MMDTETDEVRRDMAVMTIAVIVERLQLFSCCRFNV